MPIRVMLAVRIQDESSNINYLVAVSCKTRIWQNVMPYIYVESFVLVITAIITDTKRSARYKYKIFYLQEDLSAAKITFQEL